jgi:hypothetical protein
VIQSIIAEIDVEIALLQKVSAPLVNDGPKRGRWAAAPNGQLFWPSVSVENLAFSMWNCC